MKAADVQDIILYSEYMKNHGSLDNFPYDDFREDVFSVPFRFRQEIIELVYKEFINLYGEYMMIKGRKCNSEEVNEITEKVGDEMVGFVLH